MGTLSSTIRVGVAGWDYPDWKGVLYPHPRPRGFDPVRYLAGYVDVIEINSSFYGPPKKDVAKRWVERVADLERLEFTTKLWRRFTHEREEAWTRADVKQVRAGLDVLQKAGRLGALLVQFPMSFKNDEKNWEWLADVVDAFAAYPRVVEVRHASWNEPGFYAWLGEEGVGFVNIDQPLFEKSMRPSAHATGRVGYIRVHGRNYFDWFKKDAGRDARYDYLYEPKQLKPWVERAEEVAEDPATASVDVVFNNHYKAQAVVNALQFKSLLTGDDVPAPPLLYDAYKADLKDHTEPVQPEDLVSQQAA
jgi:uncharacterized protein YecE (DUF72 family)